MYQTVLGPVDAVNANTTWKAHNLIDEYVNVEPQ